MWLGPLFLTYQYFCVHLITETLLWSVNRPHTHPTPTSVLKVFQSDGTFVGSIGSEGRSSGQLAHPHYIAVSATNRVVVTDSNNHRVQVFDVNGHCLTTFGGEGGEEGKFKFPR